MATTQTENEILCGIGNFRPTWLQIFNNPKAMCVFLGLYIFIHGSIVTGVQSVNTTAFERRFHLNSVQVGWITTCIHISAVTVGTTISFLGAKNYKARWLALSIAVGGSGFILKALPHFLTPPYQWGQSDESVCRRNETTCSDDVDTELSNYLYLLMLGSFLCGISASTILTVGMSYIDDSLPVASSPLYTGLVSAMQYVGIAVGYILGGQAIRLYVDFDTLPSESWFLTTDDPRWVGAWWLPYCVAASIYFFLFIVFLLYGSELPSARRLREIRTASIAKESFDVASDIHSSVETVAVTELNTDQMNVSHDILNSIDCTNTNKNQAEIVQQSHNQIPCLNHMNEISVNSNYVTAENGNINTDKRIFNTNECIHDNNACIQKIESDNNEYGNIKTNKITGADNKKKPRLKTFVTKSMNILKSPIFVFLSLAVSCTFMQQASIAVFLPKIIQNQYNQSAATSGLLAGVLLIPGAATGQFLSGLIIKKLNLLIRGSFWFVIISSIASLPFAFTWLIYCDGIEVVGWNLPYTESTSPWVPASEPVIASKCNLNCNCQLDNYEPVCDSNHNLYFSPCFAGCSMVVSQSDQIYYNCSCLFNGGGNSTISNNSTTVTADACNYGCHKSYYVFPMLFIGTMLVNSVYIPVQTIILRTHSEVDKTFSLGIMWMFIRILGLIPGPLLLGFALDETCMVWGETCQQKVTSCWIYNNLLMARNMTLFSVSLSLGIIFMLLAAFLFYENSTRRKLDLTRTDGQHGNTRIHSVVTSISFSKRIQG